MFNKGDAVFFKAGRKGTHRHAPEGKFKGFGFGVYLGHIPPFHKDPTPLELMRLMGSIGFMTFDDLGDFLTPEQAAMCVQKFEEKYYPQPQAGDSTDVPRDEKGAPVLLLPDHGVEALRNGLQSNSASVLVGSDESPAPEDGVPV